MRTLQATLSMAGCDSAIIGSILCILLSASCVTPTSLLRHTESGKIRPFSKLSSGRATSPGGEIFEYSFGWKGIPGARFRIETREAQIGGRDLIGIGFSGSTLKSVNWAWSYRLNGITYINPGTRLPISSARISTEKGETELTLLAFDRDQSVVSSVERELYGTHELSKKTLHFQQGLDIPSALMFIRKLDWQVGQTHRIEVVADDVQIIELTASRTTEIETRAGIFDAIVVDVQIRPTVHEEQGGQEAEKYRGGQIWLSRDERHLILMVQADIFVGYVYAELVDFQNPARRYPN